MDYTVYNYSNNTVLVYKLGANNVYRVEVHAYKQVEVDDPNDEYHVFDYIVNPEVIDSYEISFIDMINDYLYSIASEYGDACEAFEN